MVGTFRSISCNGKFGNPKDSQTPPLANKIPIASGGKSGTLKCLIWPCRCIIDRARSHFKVGV